MLSSSCFTQVSDSRAEKPPSVSKFFLAPDNSVGTARRKSVTIRAVQASDVLSYRRAGVMTTSRSPEEMTRLLLDWSKGDEAALNQLIPLIEQELHRIAHLYMNRESPGHTLQTTALVNEAYLRLIDQKNVRWQNRAHFFAIASQTMRRILIDHARSHARAKRGGKARKISLDEVAVLSQERAAELVALDEALERLAALDPRRGQVVALRFYGGLNTDEIAEVLGISANTVTRDWNMARAWLARELGAPKD
jgi:RNA polymerase sigma-70 factor, ECF subfamily